MSRIQPTFDRLRAARQCALVPYIVVGQPNGRGRVRRIPDGPRSKEETR